MHKKIIVGFLCLSFFRTSFSQKITDSTVTVGQKTITLSEIVISNKLNIPEFIARIKNDTSFYKAFRNLRILGFTAINDIRMNDRNGHVKAGLRSTTKQTRINDCRKMDILEEQRTGDIYDEHNNFNYYTAQLYASLFFTKDSVCGEDNIVAGREFSTTGKTGMEKHKEQLKMLFFDPGKRINGLPFISNKTAIYDDAMAGRYDMHIDIGMYNNTNCYIFRQQVKPESRHAVIVDEMITWFDDQTFEIVARHYTLNYDAGLYDFKIQMEVMMTKFGDYRVPSLIRYIGNWKAIFKKRERGIFTATLFDFN